MGVVVKSIEISKNPVSVGEKFKIQVAVKETITESKSFRLPAQLGKPKGNLNNL